MLGSPPVQESGYIRTHIHMYIHRHQSKKEESIVKDLRTVRAKKKVTFTLRTVATDFATPSVSRCTSRDIGIYVCARIS